MVDLVSIASFVLPFVLDSMLGGRINLKGIRLFRAKRGPTLWHHMIRFAARIYRQLNYAQKQKLIDLGALHPDFEPKLEIFRIYLGQEQPVLTTSQKPQETLKTLISEIKYDYCIFNKILIKISPKDLSKYFNPFAEFKSRVSREKETLGIERIFASLDKGHPNYPDLYEHWKKLHNVK